MTGTAFRRLPGRRPRCSPASASGARVTADVQSAQAEVTLRQQPRRASAPLDAAIAHYAGANRVIFLPECYLARARAEPRLGDSAGAERDLESDISMLEREPVQL